MSNAPLDYDPRDVIVTFNGEDIFGFMKGTFVTADRMTDAFSSEAGSQGDVARIASADKRGKVVFTLQQISPSNKTMTKYLNKDAKGGKGKGALQIIDKNSDETLVHAETAWIVKVAKIEFADGLTGREWTLEAAELEMQLDGSNAK